MPAAAAAVSIASALSVKGIGKNSRLGSFYIAVLHSLDTDTVLLVHQPRTFRFRKGIQVTRPSRVMAGTSHTKIWNHWVHPMLCKPAVTAHTLCPCHNNSHLASHRIHFDKRIGRWTLDV